ncbi:MAG: sulfide/dihydroorotate dehydrogenase-like FAD/NAD-binding protein [Mogibacterium sp.]|nr:sulfide/dihydroorotate dehydrogenase-like FAD/NAD-binding protein [Mogibacterium sp.]
MYKVVRRRSLKPTVTQIEVEAPLVARKARAGQFIILRVDEDGERIPLTVAGTNPDEGTVKVIFQVVGATTEKLNHVKEGECIQDFVGPLGRPTETEGIKKVCIVGGGVGCAIAMPVAQEFHRLGAEVTSIIGFRSEDLVILEDEFDACSDRLIVMTDDGSYKREGNVTVPLKEMLAAGEKFDMIITIGPLIMMKFVTLTVKEFNAPITVSMSPIMVDGTGMCGCCRLTLHTEEGSVMKFACVDGPDFNGYEVDFDEAIARGRTYFDFERKAHDHVCNMYKAADELAGGANA